MVECYFQRNVFPFPANTLESALECAAKHPMTRGVVPDAGSNLKVSSPWADMLYGYHRYEAFPQQQAQLISMRNEMLANSDHVVYPFLIVEFKTDGLVVYV
jgi:hypothetical protein